MISWNYDCPECGAKVGQHCVTKTGNKAKSSHKARLHAAAGQMQIPLTKTTVTPPKVVKTPEEKLINHISIIVDSSYSMCNLEQKTISVFNEQLEQITKNTRETGQQTFVSLYTFDTLSRSS